MSDSCAQVLRLRAARVESYLASCLQGRAVPKTLAAAMEYSLLAGGKRLRPVLCLSSAGLCGQEEESVLPFAGALEFIHTYSLIHDDLPAMDNDDLRRGKPTNHKVFGEAAAVLAGDALLTEAFVIAAATPLPAQRVSAALAELARAAGAEGMVAGQMLDMEYTNRASICLEELAGMHALKTGALLRASCLCGGLLAGASSSALTSLADYGAALGAAFQIVDDILDITGTEAQLGKRVGSDVARGKHTYPSLLGLERSRVQAFEQSRRAQAALSAFCGPEADFLRDLAQSLATRVS